MKLDLERRLADEGLSAATWTGGSHQAFGEHMHEYDKVLVASRGSIVFVMGPSRTIELREGDRLELPAETVHGALVGPSGVTCLEAHLVRGTLTGGLRHLAQWSATAPTTPETARPCHA